MAALEEATRGIVDDALVARRGESMRQRLLRENAHAFILSSGSNTSGNDEEEQ